MKVKNKTAIICNSLNPDLKEYFISKVEGVSSYYSFYGNFKIRSETKCGISNFSPSPRLSAWLLVDTLYSVFFSLFLKATRVKVVLFDTAHISNLPLAILLKLLRVKLIFTIHDWNPHEGAQNKAVELYNKVVKQYLADEFIVFSSVNSNKKIHQLTLSGFERAKVTPKKGDYYLFFGRIEPYKGLSNVIGLSKALLDNNRDEKIIVAGRGDDPSLEALNACNNVKIINRFITDEELDDLISNAISILLPYDSATQSGVTILAYSFSKPVVAYNVGALVDYIEDGYSGYMVDPKNVTCFYEAMLKSNDNYEILSANVYKKFSQYDKAALIKQYAKLSKEL
jgi:glycosyltransferase involved in cell wall biosynthesis